MLFAIISGQMLGSVVSGFANVAFGWRSALFIASGVGAVAAIVAWTQMPATPRHGDAAPPASFAALYGRVFANPKAAWLYAAVMLEGALFYGLFPFMGELLLATTARGGNAISIETGIVLGAFGIGGLLYAASVRTAAAPARRAPDVPARLGRRRRLLRRARGRAALVARRRGDALRRPRLLHAAQLDADRGHRARALGPRLGRGPLRLRLLRRPGARPAGVRRPAARARAAGRRSSSSRWRSSSSAGSWSRASSTGRGRRRWSSAETARARRRAAQAGDNPTPSPSGSLLAPPVRAAASSSSPADHRLHDDHRGRRRQGGAARDPALRQDGAARQRLRHRARSPPGSAASPASSRRPLPKPLADWDCRNNRLAWLGLQSPTVSSTPSQPRASATARPASRWCSAPRPRASARPKRPTARSTAKAAFRRTSAIRWCTRRIRSPASCRRRSALEGPSVTVSTACSSSAKVFAAAERLIRLGLADAAVVGGVDTLCGSVLFGFNSLRAGVARAVPAVRRRRATASASARPPASRCSSAPPRRGGDGLALLGYGESSDAHHMSTPHPEGLGAERALDDALARAGLDAERHRLHQPARHRQPKNDEVEARWWRGASRRAPTPARPRASPATRSAPPASSRPSISLLALEHGFMPGTVNTRTLDRRLRPADPARAGARRGALRAEQFLRLRRQQLRRWCFGKRSRGMTRPRRHPTLYIEGLAFWAPTLPGWDDRARGVPRRRRAGRPAGQRPVAASAGAGRAPARARHAWRWRSKWRPRRCAPRAATRRPALRVRLDARRSRASTTTCAHAGDRADGARRRPSSTTRCTTPPPATGPSAPAAWRRATR